MRTSKMRQKGLCYGGPCWFCLSAVGGVSSLLPLGNLNARYYQPQIQSNHFRKVSQLLKESAGRQCCTLAQIDKNSSEKQFIDRYYYFEDTVRCISQVVRNRVGWDRLASVHFFGDVFAISGRYQTNCRKLKCQRQGQANVNKPHSYDQQLLQLPFSNKVLKGIDTPTKQEPNSTTIDLKLLTSNIDIMTKKLTHFTDMKQPRQRKSKGKSQRRVEKKKILGLKKQFEGISAIKKKQEKKKQKIKYYCNQLRQEQETYGLERVKAKHLGNKLERISKMTANRQALLSPLSLPQSPNPHCLLLRSASRSANRSQKSRSSRHRVDQMTLTSFPSSPSLHRSGSGVLTHSLSGRGGVCRRKR